MSDLAFLDVLNPEQRAAVEAPDAPVLVVAGPGSGKTRVLISRVAYVLATRPISSYQIMAVTFTNKAAKEMQERILTMQGQNLHEVMIGTFHSICARLLRREAGNLGIDRNFSIYDTDDQVNVIKSALTELNLNEKSYKPSSIQAAISGAKNNLIGPDDYQPHSYFEEIVKRVYDFYQRVLKANSALDFDDLIGETARLLREKKDVCDRLQARYRHILVDEFQDTNGAQYELVKLLTKTNQCLFAVGDLDQSIYSWRGADYRNVLRLEEDYPTLHIYKLNQNYRSTQTILDAAMQVIQKNSNRQHLHLRANKGEGNKVVMRELYNEEEEAEFVVATMKNLVQKGETTLGQVGIMYRTNAQSRAVEDAFVRHGIPYRLVGGTRFYARREVKDMLAYLRMTNNPNDTVSLMRVINLPARGIGDKTISQLQQTAAERNTSLFQLLSNGESSGRAAQKLNEFGTLWKAWVDMRSEVPIAQLFEHVLYKSGYAGFIQDGTPEGEERWANLMELRHVASAAGDISLNQFLNDIALVSDTEGNKEENAAAPTLLTLHAAKGLEYKTVFLVGLQEGILPHSRSLEDHDQLAEERRLFYVGMTRAKEHLYLLHTFRRNLWGQVDASDPSRFLSDLPDHVLEQAPRKKVVASAFSKGFGKTSQGNSWSSGNSNKPSAGVFGRDPSELLKSANTLFKTGDRVVHAKFGEGVVVSSVKQRDDEEVQVNFSQAGQRKLSAQLSGLMKLR